MQLYSYKVPARQPQRPARPCTVIYLPLQGPPLAAKPQPETVGQVLAHTSWPRFVADFLAFGLFIAAAFTFFTILGACL